MSPRCLSSPNWVRRSSASARSHATSSASWRQHTAASASWRHRATSATSGRRRSSAISASSVVVRARAVLSSCSCNIKHLVRNHKRSKSPRASK
ncbi:hypothetical protein Taro_052640 [Colocasia esculenta]|uniref:Uncharacterized protein n=1 Tax=Colocasia esculenta TaxID=4460 RepID=A0A843XKC3_COLES|nr:hypothetical protein [Colocasia esculenta]